ncbi:MAG TPA: RsmD family RNA methyltransferase [Armatimonadota bacterium]|nr:RsmD family RNA methyltransferase [Armatimonadota bacterium]
MLVEKSRQGAGIIRANLAVLDEEERDAAEVRQGEALPAIIMLARSGEQFDLIFADPPYEDTEAPGKVLATLAEAESLLAEGVLVTIQHTRHVSLPESVGRLRLQQTKRYGDTMLSMYALEKE